MINEPYYKYLERYLYDIVRRYNNGDRSLYNDIMQVCKEYNADAKLTHQNNNENLYPFIEIIRDDLNKPLKAIKKWFVLNGGTYEHFRNSIIL